MLSPWVYTKHNQVYAIDIHMVLEVGPGMVRFDCDYDHAAWNNYISCQ